MKKRSLLFLLVTLGAMLGVQAQNAITMVDSMDRTGCSFVVYDCGGLHGDYTANRNDKLTIHSGNANAACVQVEFILADFDVDPSDSVFIYDGLNEQAPLLAMLNNDVVANISATSIVLAATVTNSSGALTIKFVSDGSAHGGGFVFNTTCVAPCQRVQVELDSILSSHFPKQDTDGFFYINVCPYDTVHFVAHGVYPDNNFSYNQNDPTSVFTWDMNLQTIDSVGLDALDYYFTPGRGYDISINIEDSAGCKSTMPYIFRVRTSQNPIRGLSPLPEVCAGATLNISTGYDNLSTVQVDTVGSEQITALSVNDTIFLPDGEPCSTGCAYQSPVTFTSFAPSAVIQSADDILFVRIRIEHSFIGDIFIGLTCPNGQMAKIMNKYGSSGATPCAPYVPLPWGWQLTSGVSSGADFGVVQGNSGNKCDPLTNPMGTTWNYCWSNNTSPTYGYQYASGSGYVYETVNVHNGIVDSTNVAQMTQVYHPDESFDALIGCPMNGTWAITVIDAWGADNGWITEWELALDPSLLPQDWSYQVLVDSTALIGPGADGDYAVPDTAGTLHYIVRVFDEYGCHYDTTAVLEVTPHPEPDLGPDFNICYGDMVKLSADYDEPNTDYKWNTGSEEEEIIVVSEGTYILNVSTTNAAGTLTCSGGDTIHVGVFESPMLDFDISDTVGCAPVTIRFTNNSTPVDAVYEWMILRLDGTLAYSSFLREPSFEIDEPGTYAVYLKATTMDGCKDSVIKWNYFVVNMQPIAEFVATPDISLMSETGGVVDFHSYTDSVVMAEPGTSFYWDFADGEVDSSSIHPQHTYSSWGDYDVVFRVETESGCYSEIAHTVVIEQDLVFPNVITPNGDGLNDVFAIENLNTSINVEDPDKYRNNKLFIYDRWGKKVYEAHNYDTFAKGGQVMRGSQFFDGSGLADGVYYYSFYYKGKAKTVNYNGSLTIIR
ncbi:MAG: gliding motility-associated C-terminal domain-containing protein [Bacteroidales bacterium]|nr:gliding motility-associated C-terminal domain-containing protein [Bacteroidales bacterium]